jgi:hypothetical protein
MNVRRINLAPAILICFFLFALGCKTTGVSTSDTLASGSMAEDGKFVVYAGEDLPDGQGRKVQQVVRYRCVKELSTFSKAECNDGQPTSKIYDYVWKEFDTNGLLKEGNALFGVSKEKFFDLLQTSTVSPNSKKWKIVRDRLDLIFADDPLADKQPASDDDPLADEQPLQASQCIDVKLSCQLRSAQGPQLFEGAALTTAVNSFQSKHANTIKCEQWGYNQTDANQYGYNCKVTQNGNFTQLLNELNTHVRTRANTLAHDLRCEADMSTSATGAWLAPCRDGDTPTNNFGTAPGEQCIVPQISCDVRSHQGRGSYERTRLLELVKKFEEQHKDDIGCIPWGYDNDEFGVDCYVAEGKDFNNLFRNMNRYIHDAVKRDENNGVSRCEPSFAGAKMRECRF